MARLPWFEFGMPDGWLGRDDCWQLVEPFAAALCSAVADGHHHWPEWTSDELRGRVEPKDRGQCVTSLIWEAAKDRLAEPIAKNKIRFCRALGIRKFIIGGAVAVRIKTAGPDLTVMRTRTQQDDAWYSNRSIEGFSDLLTRINVAFRTVPGDEAVRDIHLTWQATPSTVGWRIQMGGEGTGTLPIAAGPIQPIKPTSGGVSLPKIEITPLGGGKSRKKGDDAG